MREPQYDADSGVMYRQLGALAFVTLDHPRTRNAISIGMRRALLQRIGQATADDTVRVLVLQGSEGNFCAGGDIASMADRIPTEDKLARLAPIIACARALLECPKPIIASIDGVAYGGGLGLALCADLVVATPRARLCASFLRLGLVPDFLMSFTIPRILGWQRAKSFIYSVREIDGREAYAMGLVSELIEHDVLNERVQSLASAFANISPTAFQLTKQALLRSFSSDLNTTAFAEINAQVSAMMTAYHSEAVARFLDKTSALYRWP